MAKVGNGNVRAALLPGVAALAVVAVGLASLSTGGGGPVAAQTATATDTDGDGVDDVVEDAAPSASGIGDVDGNGVADSLQPELASFVDPALDAGTLGIDYVSAVATTAGSLSVGATVTPASEPAGALARTSVLDVRIVGLPTAAGPAVATLDLYAPVNANGFFAYDGATDTWTDLTAVASFDGVEYRTGPAQPMRLIDTRVPLRWRTQLTIEDGGFGDGDGVVNGVVTVFGAVAQMPPPPPPSDSDGDGVDDVVEDGAPNNGDLTINGVPDSQESNAASLPDPTLSDLSGSNYIAVDGYYLLDPATYPTGSSIAATPLADVSITAPPTSLPDPNAGLVTGLISYVQTGLPVDGQPGANALPGDPVPESPATAGTFVSLPRQPDSFWTYDGATGTWTDATQLINIVPDWGIDSYDVGGLTYWGLEILIVDGGVGDADGAVNGEVKVLGAFAARSTDADGVADVVEDAAPNNGDGNGDGILDSQQSNVTSLEDPYLDTSTSETTTNYITIDSTGDSTTLRNVAVIDETAVEEPAPESAGVAQSSLISFTVDGLTVDEASPAVAVVDIYVPQLANSYWKYDETAPVGSRWIDATSIATFATEPTADGRWKITLAIEDGGPFDFDGVVNGSVEDPGQARFIDVGARFEGVSLAFDTSVLYEANAGRSIPMRWRITDPDGAVLRADVTGPPSVVSRSVPCVADEGADVFELDGTSFEEPIQLENGDWLFVWKTSKNWSGTCRSFEVSYGLAGLQASSVDYVFR